MILTFFIIAAITAGGTALTYLYEREDSLLARLAAGNVVGSAVFGTAGFLLACFIGLTPVTVGLALGIALAPLVLLRDASRMKMLRANLNKARGKLDGANAVKVLRFLYYVFIAVVLWFFFERAMIETTDGIITGGSQNLGDLPFHLGAIFSFTDGGNFPPANPSYANAKFTYPFLADFITSCFMRLGAGVRDAMLVQNVTLGFSLVVLLERFTAKITGSTTAGKIAPILLLFSGGLGFVSFWNDYRDSGMSFMDILWKLPRDYTIGEKYRWGNSLVTLFLTQRSLLFGMPIAIIALGKVWELFSSERVGEQVSERGEKTESGRDGEKVSGRAGEKKSGRDEEKGRASKSADAVVSPSPLLTHCSSSSPLLTHSSSSSPLLTHSSSRPLTPTALALCAVGLLAGTLPLIHVHSLAALFVVCALLFFFRLDRWKEWIAFGVGVSVIAVPELIWSLSGSATNLAKFVEPHFGWDAGKQNIIVFWARNTGLFAPVFAFGFYLMQRKGDDESDKDRTSNLFIFYVPFAFLFVISNTMKLAPWEWDNIKVLIYWFVGSLPFAAFALAWLWERSKAFKTIAVALIFLLTAAGALDVWRTVTAQINYNVFSKDSVKIAEFIKLKTPPNALFLNGPTYNSAVVLTGRRSLMRYSGHLSSYGIDYEPRESEVKRIYEGTAMADRLLEKNKIEYVIISPEEYGNLAVNEEFFAKFPIVAEAGDIKVYKIK